jgi:pectin methylesterase-like acyl-CoA thioesterase
MMPQMCPRSVVSTYRLRSQRGLIALLVGLALSVGLSIGAQAATTWTVCANGCDYTSIKAAIAAPPTLDGDTLAIAAGIYTEAGITVTKSLTLQGEGAATTIVQAAETPATAPDRVFTIPSGVTATLQSLTMGHTDAHQ